MSLSQVSLSLSGPRGFGAEVVLRHLGGVVIDRVEAGPGRLRLWAHPRADQARCPGCGCGSGRVHSRYQRRLADVPAGGAPVVIYLMVRRFFCDGARCPAVTFAEQVEGLTAAYARRSVPLGGMLGAVALAVAGRAGARLAAALGMVAGRGVLLRLIAAMPVPAAGPVRVLGVDDFAFRRSHVYGTILVDVATGAPVDLLPDRQAATLAAWLAAHPGTEVICRDRAGAYADGAREGAPAAVQVADRWHLWHNLAGHVGKAAARHRYCLVTTTPPGPPPRPAPPPPPARGMAARTRQRHATVHALRAQGYTLTAIAGQLGLTRATVRHYARAATAGELTASHRRPSILDPFIPYLHQRWNDGQRTITALHAEITAMGYHGTYGNLCQYLAPLRATTPPAPPHSSAPPPTPPPAPPPPARQIASWILRHPATLTPADRDDLAAARARCPDLDTLATHVAAFAAILTSRRGSQLDTWMTQASTHPDLAPFTTGIRNDYQAVRNGLTLPYSSGTVEGNVNRLKMIKRQTYGRAGFPLLRKRVLLMT